MNRDDPRTALLAITARQPLDSVAAWPDVPDTTRRYPRTLEEAFPTPDRHNWMEGPFYPEPKPAFLKLAIGAAVLLALCTTLGAYR